MVTWLDLIFNGIIVASIVFAILITYRIVLFLIRREGRKQRIPVEAMNGIKILVRLIVVLLIIIALLNYIPGFTSYLLAISSITGIIVGFASTQVVSQIVAGIYLLISRPLKVNDLVRINGNDGLIIEVGLNFTTMQKFNGSIVKIPNKTILDAEIRKFTIRMTPEIADTIGKPINQERLDLEEEIILNKSKKLKLSDLKNIILESEIIRYTFEIAVDLDKVPDKVVDAVNKICDKHSMVYQYRPQFILTYIYWRAHFRFKIFCQNPYIIIKNQSHFIHDLMVTIYGGG